MPGIELIRTRRRADCGSWSASAEMFGMPTQLSCNEPFQLNWDWRSSIPAIADLDDAVWP
jgi:hypothetical protein